MKTYTLDKAKDEIAHIVAEHLGKSIGREDVLYPPENIAGDFAFPCFSLAKEQKKSPAAISAGLKESIILKSDSLILHAESQGGYLNFFLREDRFFSQVIDDFQALKERYGRGDLGKGKKIIIDYSSPNIAKPFSVGHLRSTNIGSALYRILEFTGYEVLGDNHVGDWGTQFGKLIYAYRAWGDAATIEANPIPELLKLYTRFHEEAGLNDESREEPRGTGNTHPLEEEARRCFKQLEEKDPEVIKLWEWIRKVSLQSFEKVYQELGITFDMILGESFYNDRMEHVLDKARSRGLVEEDKEGALLIRLDDYGITTPLLIQKKDGASLYATRDLACALYRIEQWNPDMILYVVGEEQQLYFKQLFKVLDLMGYTTRCEHIYFGLIVLAEGKLSTRAGRVIFLEDVIDEAVQKAHEIIRDRDFPADLKDKIARIVGIGAIKYNDLSQNRKKTVTFEWEKMLALDGNSSPYLQYSYARARSILRKSEAPPSSFSASLITHDEEKKLIKKLARFPEAIRDAASQFYPHLLATYLFELSQIFTTLYNNLPVLGAASAGERDNRLILLGFFSEVMKAGLKLLGIEVMEEM
jgi:arginyl-tRNA synthetase